MIEITLEIANQIFDWTAGDKRGVSANTMLFAVTGKSVYGDSRGIPADWSDFSRCINLCKKVPAIKENLHLVAEMYPKWIPIVREWNNLENTFFCDSKNFYNELSKLHDECMECDGFTKISEGSWRKST